LVTGAAAGRETLLFIGGPSLRIKLKDVVDCGALPNTVVLGPVAGETENGADTFQKYCLLFPPEAVKGMLMGSLGENELVGQEPLIWRGMLTTI
jgi:hypothetical protein